MSLKDHEDHQGTGADETSPPEVAGADTLSPASVPSGQVTTPASDPAPLEPAQPGPPTEWPLAHEPMAPPPAPWRTAADADQPERGDSLDPNATVDPDATRESVDDEPAADESTTGDRARSWHSLRPSLLAGLVGGVVGALIATGVFVAVDDGRTTTTGLGPSTEVFTRPSREVARAGDLATILAADVPAVVAIVADGGPNVGGAAGTGFVISEDGVVVTNNHVVEGSSRIEARFSDGTSLVARVLGTDAASDLAVLHVDGAGLPAVELGDSDAVQVGDDVVAIGNALALEGGLSVTRGIVSGLHRTVPTSRNSALVDVIQTDAAINPGNSGGPLVDSRGRVIAINTAIADPTSAQNVGFAIPISQAKPIIDALRAGNRPAYLGVTIDTSATVAGARVQSVASDSPASRAGFRVGDVITRIGDQDVTSWEELRPAIRRNTPGSTAEVIVDRDGDRVTLHVKFEQDPGAS